ncbi:hypothetical protein SARC_14843, partial [Sphaeroforma arctica JP610]
LGGLAGMGNYGGTDVLQESMGIPVQITKRHSYDAELSGTVGHVTYHTPLTRVQTDDPK